MDLCLTMPLVLGSADHSYNTALQIFDSPAMFSDDLCLPTMPSYAGHETNWGTLEWLRCDLTLISDQQLSAANSYWLYGYDELDQPF